MATTSNTYTGDGSTTLFSFTFPYISESDVKVQLDGTATTQFTFSNATTLALTTAPASGVTITIFRETNIEDVASAFYAGSSIKAKDLNDNFIQTLYVSQEVSNEALSTLGGTLIGQLDMSNQKIVSLGTPTAATDASTRGYVDGLITTHQAQVDAAAASATASASSASSSATSATNSATSASTSSTQATNSANSATASANSATASANSATASANSATTAANEAVTATTQATNASNSASTATTQATNASTSASAAATSASQASTSETNAANSATDSSNSATSAATSAASALAAFDNFDDTYLGAKAADPTVDNDGDALTAGDLYFNTTNEVMKLYTGTAWVIAYVPGDAANITFTAAGNLAGTNVQAAIQELDTEKIQKTSATGAAKLPSGTAAQRDNSPAAGYIRFNTDVTHFEGYTGTAWASVGGGATGGGSDTWAVEHDNTITQSYTIGTGKNVISAGPLTVNSGATVTVPSGSNWVIV